MMMDALESMLSQYKRLFIFDLPPPACDQPKPPRFDAIERKAWQFASIRLSRCVCPHTAPLKHPAAPQTFLGFARAVASATNGSSGQ